MKQQVKLTKNYLVYDLLIDSSTKLYCFLLRDYETLVFDHDHQALHVIDYVESLISSMGMCGGMESVQGGSKKNNHIDGSLSIDSSSPHAFLGMT